MTAWGSPIELERKRRIQVALWAWAYEEHDTSLVSDALFDETCYAIDPKVSTKNRKLDNFFKKHFEPHTGQWVHLHPEKHKLDCLVRRRLNIQKDK